MQANWSLILNVLLLIGVVVAIGRLMKVRRQSLNHTPYQPSLGKMEESRHFDDIIAVRKVSLAPVESDGEANKMPDIVVRAKSAGTSSVCPETSQDKSKQENDAPGETGNEPVKSVMMFLLAKENRQLAGYELLQTVLAAGLRFGEGHLFHRHQQANGQGPVLCSLAAATSTGVFDLQNIGAFSVRGLCLFMEASGNPTIDAERFGIMYDTARQLSDGLNTYLLDDRRRPLTEEGLARYHQLLNISVESELSALA
ncbi:cell division protein ZipA C-terminal FtsZ-binding domain-containing protein [Legionella spiritensis]|uniref:cell division protein ZipA C-terminal FtsZ-binding domain-containing protein n=1 Tax=Legionella spiritensis TaxID=452 RepID=UPI000F712E7F|nr:cell division protein ZipA C-terminal FtsZ-binding domain-containing protein [Legionella spiritensis]VEG91326.1 cell division protein ZipA [Legionella spiritensis]